MDNSVSRRQILGLALTGAATFAFGHMRAAASAAPKGMKPGDFTWQPHRAPKGAVVIIVSIPDQLVHVYRAGVEIGVSTCSTGRPGHRTPTGVFTILQKARVHHSNLYHNAPMPDMQRLTWTGIALHAGDVPGYPDSHGCAHLPLKFAKLLFNVTHIGSVVIIADAHTQPRIVVHSGLLIPKVAESEASDLASKVAKKKGLSPWAASAPYATVSLVISAADRLAYLIRDGALEASMPISIVDPGKPLGMHVYSLVGPAADGSGLLWTASAVSASKTAAHTEKWEGDKVLNRIHFKDPDRARAIARSLHPGTALIVTDKPAPPDSRKAPKNFTIISTVPSGQRAENDPTDAKAMRPLQILRPPVSTW